MEVDYSKGGKPVILVPDDILEGSGLCRAANQGQVVSSTGGSNGSGRRLNVSVASTVFFAILVLLFIR